MPCARRRRKWRNRNERKKNDPVDGQIVAAIEELGEVITKDNLKKLQMILEDNKNAAEIWLNAVRKKGNEKAVKSWNLLMHHNMIAWQAIGRVIDGYKEVTDEEAFHDEFCVMVKYCNTSDWEQVGSIYKSLDAAREIVRRRNSISLPLDYATRIERRDVTNWKVVEVNNVTV